MFFTALLPLISVILVASKKLSTDENERNAKVCGVHHLGENDQQPYRLRRSVGGREVQSNEYPWTARIEIKNVRTCTGVQISPRHILTAAHCVMHMRNLENCRENPDSVVWKMGNPKSLNIRVGTNKKNESDSCDEYRYEASKIIPLDFNPCENKDDIALIELKSDISNSVSTPICMPTENHIIDQVLYSTGYGTDHSHNKMIKEPVYPSVVAQTLKGVDSSSQQIVTNAYGKSICQGDSGGPLFQVDGNHKHVLIGIVSMGEDCTRTNRHNIANWAVDVRPYLDWICRQSGRTKSLSPVTAGDTHERERCGNDLPRIEKNLARIPFRNIS